MIRNFGPSLFERAPARSAEVSVAGWVGAAWLACALWLALALLDRDSPHRLTEIWASGLATAAIMGGTLWLAGLAVSRLFGYLSAHHAARAAPVLRIVVMAMFVLSFMAATGLSFCWLR